MKKKLASISTLAVLLFITTWGIRQVRPQLQLSDLDITNIEALANPEV